MLTLLIDQSLWFANTRFLEDCIYDQIADDKALRNVILMCPAINEIDMSALETLESVDERLQVLGIILHLSEVKGPVMDRLHSTNFLEELTSDVF